MSDSVLLHRRQPTRLPRPWDSPGKNTGVGCHCLLQCMKSESEVAQSCLTLSNPIDCSLPGSSVHGILQARTLEWVAISFSTINLQKTIKNTHQKRSKLRRFRNMNFKKFLYLLVSHFCCFQKMCLCKI